MTVCRFTHVSALSSQLLLAILQLCYFLICVEPHLSVLSLGVVQDAFRRRKGTIDGAHTGAVLCGHKQMAMVYFYPFLVRNMCLLLMLSSMQMKFGSNFVCQIFVLKTEPQL